jgi:hypothetical protein
VPDATEQPEPRPAERILRSLGNHVALIQTHADHCRRHLAELALIIVGSN